MVVKPEGQFRPKHLPDFDLPETSSPATRGAYLIDRPRPLGAYRSKETETTIMNLKVPLHAVTVWVPAWCVIVMLAWPIVFFSFAAHELLAGGDALNGKVEGGKYFLRGWRQPVAGETTYIEVSKARYRGIYVHSIAMLVFSVPAVIGMTRVIRAATRGIQAANGTSKR